jgi:hypothetical protein
VPSHSATTPIERPAPEEPTLVCVAAVLVLDVERRAAGAEQFDDLVATLHRGAHQRRASLVVLVIRTEPQIE